MTKPSTSRPSAVLPVILLSSLLVSGCKQQKITSYEVPKEKAQSEQAETMPSSAMTGNQRVIVAIAATAGTTWFFKMNGDEGLVANEKSNLVAFLKGVQLHAPAGPAAAGTKDETAEKPSLNWGKLPDGWQGQEASGMRAATFSIAGQEGQKAELGVIPMPIDMTGRELEFVNMWREQIGLPAATSDVLNQIRESVTIGGLPGQLFEMANDGAGSNPHAGLGMASLGGSLPKLENTGSTPTWTVPDGWKSISPGAMDVAKYDLPGGPEVGVLPLAGDGGGLLMNLNRWRGQLQLKPATEADLASLTSTIDAADTKATLIDMTGSGKRIVGLIVPHGGQTWFYKCVGDPEAVGRSKDAFLQFARSAQY